jgi:hypothetical protein
MKNKLKHLFKLGILILGISLFNLSCQKDDDINIINKEINGEKSPFKFSEINESQINQNKSLGRKLNSITNNIKQSKLANANKQIYSTEDDFYIDTDYATYIENTETNYHSYTFPVFRTVKTNNIENVLLSLQADGNYKAMLVTYNLTAQERIDLDNGININFNDKVNIYSLEDDAFVNDIFSKILYVDNCVSINYNVIPCDGGYSEEHTSRPNSTLGRDCSGTSTQFVSFSVNPACTSGGAGSNNTYTPPSNPSGYDTSGGHGTGGTFNGSGNHTSMTKPQPWQEVAMCINGAMAQSGGQPDNTTLTPEMIAWLQTQPKFITGPINSNLQAENCSEEAQEQAIEALMDLFIECIDNGNCSSSDCELIVDFEIGCSTLLIFEQDYKNRMSVSEKQIFESMSRFNQLGYLANAQKATWKSEELFPNSLTNGKGDAFRHAYWNALNVILLGDNLAESLATAHEDQPPTYTYSYKETQMDLFNNEVGRGKHSWFSDGFSSLTNSILNSITNGELRYLSHLQGGASSGLATFQSQLIPTN